MITIQIGDRGRLGNQMFQYASLMGIAHKQNLKYGINFEKFNGSNWNSLSDTDTISRSTIILPLAFDLKVDHSIDQKNILFQKVEENDFYFDERFFNTGDNIHLDGYFQSEKYFKHIENEVRDQFRFKNEIIEKTKTFLNKNKTVAVHVRRTDYTTVPHFPLCTVEYYKQAFSFFGNDYNFIVLADDRQWAYEYLKPLNKRVTISESCNQFIDLCIMTLCEHNIIANSSYSWWGAWLNNNLDKKVIAPKNWFGPPFKFDARDLYCEGWITI